MIFFEYSQKY